MTRKTTAQHHTGHNWTGMVDVPTDLSGDDRAAWYAAAGILGCHESAVVTDGIVYLAGETGEYYHVVDSSVLDLGQRELAGERDAYSEWCSDPGSATLLTAETLGEAVAEAEAQAD